VSNPPFYEKGLKSANKLKNIAHHDEGLKLRILLAIIKKHLAGNGQFFLLLPAKREAELAYLLKEFNFDLIQKVFVRQTVHHQPFRILVQAGQNQNTVSQLSEIVIKEKDNHYSAAFISLLKDYYLYL
jgi:tRNA1Val (adenine37-N6)-methyltransferase